MKVTPENLRDAVKGALALCAQSRAQTSDAHRDQMEEDLQVAQRALGQIASELDSGNINARTPRSGAFTRYVVDEEERMVLDPMLRDLIVQIEHVYRRM